MLRLNVKLSEVQLLCLLATVHALPLFLFANADYNIARVLALYKSY